MRFISYCAIFLFTNPLLAQINLEELDFATDSFFLRRSEKEMIKEINFVRAHPQEYLKILIPYLDKARQDFRELGGTPTSSTYRRHYRKNDEGIVEVIVDTIWYNQYEENFKAIGTLVRQLKNMRPVPVLKAHEGIYEAASNHSKDLEVNNWEHSHKGADGRWPKDRIMHFANDMIAANENLYGLEGENTPRDVVIALLIDSGMKGYRRRANLLNPSWTHIACYYGGFYNNKHHWIQNFGKINMDEKEGLLR